MTVETENFAQSGYFTDLSRCGAGGLPGGNPSMGFAEDVCGVCVIYIEMREIAGK